MSVSNHARVSGSMLPLPLTLSTPQCLLHWLDRTPDAIAVIEQDHPYSYGDLSVSVVQYVQALRARSATQGTLIGIACENRYLHLILLLAAEIVGATAVSFSKADVLSNDPILARCGLLCLEDGSTMTLPVPVMSVGQEAIDRIARIPVSRTDFGLLDCCPDDEAVVILTRTSGSTGRPKVLPMTQGLLRDLTQKTERFPDDPGHAWNFLNLYGFTLRSAYNESTIALRAGCTVVSSQLWSLVSDMGRFEAFRTTMVSGDAVRFIDMLPEDWHTPRTGIVNIKGGPLPPSVRRVLRQRVASHVFHTYGAIEVQRIAFIDEAGIGHLTPAASVRIMTDDGREAAPGEVGTVEVRTGMMVQRYLWDEEASRTAFRDGWYRTNDLGTVPEPGKLVVLGRADDVVNIGGIKLAPQMLEQRIRDLDGIEDAVLLTVPVPDAEDALYLVLQSPDAAAFGRNQEAILAILSGSVRVFVPRVMETLPRTDTGKVRREPLRRLLAGSGAA